MSKNILLVEDDPDTRYVVSFMLRNAGYNVSELSTGDAILNGLSDLPDLFILDIGLPRIDGFKICEHLRSQNETHKIPILLMSAFRTARKKILTSGWDFIQKPFALTEFLNAVEKQFASTSRQAS
jgi:DNA-binding response OmpR family regulator